MANLYGDYDSMLEELQGTVKDAIDGTFSNIIERLEIIYKRTALDQYTKADLKAELKELLDEIG